VLRLLLVIVAMVQRVMAERAPAIESAPSVDEPSLLLDLVLMLPLAPRTFRLVLMHSAGLPGQRDTWSWARLGGASRAPHDCYDTNGNS